MDYDVIVVGGGSAGLMAAAAAGERGARVLLLDKGDKLGRKLGISGGGRCNVTNNKEYDELIKWIPGNGRFLYSALSQFGSRDIVAFFEGLGIALKEEDNGRMFPVSDKAKTVVDALIGRVRSLGVEVRINSPVERVVYENGRAAGVRLRGGQHLGASCVIVAVGGKSVPKTGSTGDGYPWAEEAGHTITRLFPTEVPLTSGAAYIQSKELQGLSLRGIEMTVWNAKGKKLVSHNGDMLFTHFGLSGPAALRCSQYVVKELDKQAGGTVRVTIDLMPERSADDVYRETMNLTAADPKKAIKNVLKSALPEKLIPLLLIRAELDEMLTHDNIPKTKWTELARLVKAFPVPVNGTLSIEEAFVTGGGVHLKEIDPHTMQSKRTDGLYFCGEILDIHGYTGGYNITAAFSTGHAAGTDAAERALELRTSRKI
ncbi:NAD(P)/FAD-dependent oxidoreductase [Saccharibacillus sp. CPCC 101409]|uniref:NAD(P)/FAD-dependent oxidoreductase n=1 Tax=Saccharibacillus sp. CPCC 101409 TaxID=3058041 RepID=UPI0026723A39|nr:NAD(P)/FAD-dependent oxidoreductase [Saccharibacillus sp. CPCC 101409]MDO3412641.1 NAD(P)/FAD-dependent oxidoreductase [Saccharibacillus sp. CPCC 101409]